MVDVIECAFVPRAIVPLFKEEDKINLLPAFKSKSVVFISRLPPVFLKYSVLLCLKLKTPLPLMNIPSPSIAALEPSARTPPASVCTSNVLVFIFRFSAFNSNPAEFVNLRYSFESFCKLNSPLPLKNIPSELRFVGAVPPSAIVPPLAVSISRVTVSIFS